MVGKARIEISQEALAAAEKNATAGGFATADAYVEALLLDDYDAIVRQTWFQKKVAEGETSPIVGELTRERVSQLVQQGIGRATRAK